MRTITATELARNLRQVLDRLAVEGGEIIVERNHRQVARILPGRGHQTALEAMAGLYRTLPDPAGADWLANSRDLPGVGDLADEARDPWAS
ncbi:MAG: type II toxin-antitoxin system Phd/YefM family antitoxin [Thermoleophilia bacterium]|jgi:antitoxin (DNA-binding transcriptional repressor) of toxin-antitoxin stability system|nr:type II toxin-antitoxin system Phd/YefM family antitoxin [Thermoleophilia bacterium]